MRVYPNRVEEFCALRRYRVVQFGFQVPNTVQNGAIICTQLFFGQDRRKPFFNTLARKDLFCILKGFTGGFSVVPEEQARELFRQLDGPTLTAAPLRQQH